MLQLVERRTAGIAEALRLLSHGLHPSVLQHIGLVAALHAHCAEVERQHQVRVRFDADGDVEPASRAVALSLFRIAQEALRNAVLHGRARHAGVALSRTDTHLTMMVTDDGAGFDLADVRGHEGLGLMSIEERARLVNGRAVIRTQPGRGTEIRVSIPAVAVDAADARPRPQPRRTAAAARRK